MQMRSYVLQSPAMSIVGCRRILSVDQMNCHIRVVGKPVPSLNWAASSKLFLGEMKNVCFMKAKLLTKRVLTGCLGQLCPVFNLYKSNWMRAYQQKEQFGPVQLLILVPRSPITVALHDDVSEILQLGMVRVKNNRQKS